MRLIDADALVAELKWLQSQVSSASAIEIQEYIDRTNRQPTIEAAQVVHGRWIPIHEYENKRCSVCRTVFSDFTLGYYCAHCGARMDGDGNV